MSHVASCDVADQQARRDFPAKCKSGMPFRVSESQFHERYAECFDICAEASECSTANVRLLSIEPHYKSAIAFLSDGSSGGPTHVVKINENPRWDPQREFDGLRFLERTFTGVPSLGGFSLGAVPAIGFGRSPAFVVTRFQSFSSMRPAFDRAVLSLTGGGGMEDAATYCRVAAHWLALFRSSGTSSGGMEVETYRDSIQSCTATIAERFRRPEFEQTWLPKLARQVDSIGGEDLRRFGLSYSCHGDFCPQNFQIDTEGTVYVLDIGNYCNWPLDVDLSLFRGRMEHYALRGPWARRRAQRLWRTFWDEYTGHGASETFALYCYCHSTLHQLSRLASEDWMLKKRKPLKTRIRNRLWQRDRLRWFSSLSGDPKEDARVLRDRL